MARYVVLYVILILTGSTGCSDKNGLPEVITGQISLINVNSATAEIIVNSDGGLTISACGVCWSTNTTPTVLDNIINADCSAGIYCITLNNLVPNTTYFFRAYATNGIGISYGIVKSFTTYSVMDVDGNGYNSVLIGDQEWMTENLKTTKYNNGSPIQNVYWYNNDPATYKDTFGPYYLGYQVNNSICPAGWHLPDYEDVNQLINLLGGKEVAGGKLKESGYEHWLFPNTGATDEFFFSALPTGGAESGCAITGLGQYCYFRIYPIGQPNSGGGGFYSVKMDYNSATIKILGCSEFEGWTTSRLSVRCLR